MKITGFSSLSCKIFLGFCRKFSGKVVKTAFQGSRGRFRRKLSLVEKFYYFNFLSDFEENVLHVLARVFRQNFQNGLLRVQSLYPGESNAIEQKHFYSSFRIMGDYLVLCWETFDVVVRKRTILRVHGIVFSRIFREQFPVLWMFFKLQQNLWACLSQLFFTCPKKDFYCIFSRNIWWILLVIGLGVETWAKFAKKKVRHGCRSFIQHIQSKLFRT